MRREPGPTLWARWRIDRRGLAAVEFALLLPLMLIVYLGGYQISQAVSAYRKVSDTTIELANVVTQYTTMGDNDMDNVMTASSQIMSPFQSSNLKIVVSEVVTDSSNSVPAKVAWSQDNQGGCGLKVGSSITLPTGMSSKSSYYLLVQTNYTWTSTVTSSLIKNIPMSDQIYMIPRESANIIKQPGACNNVAE